MFTTCPEECSPKNYVFDYYFSGFRREFSIMDAETALYVPKKILWKFLVQKVN